jgi:hypothetical protein
MQKGSPIARFEIRAKPSRVAKSEGMLFASTKSFFSRIEKQALF